jgi:glycosyltransferase involved in cell wall biosynthesis
VRVLIASGIWPPDVGGPASHAPELAAWLRARGHDVEAVITAGAQPPSAGYPVHWISRSLPPGVRHAAVVALVARRARAADVVYATSMSGRAAAGASLAHTPYVLKITSDPAFERTRRRGLVDGVTADFQRGGGGSVAAVLRRVRNRAIARAAHVVCPSEFMRDLVVSWGCPPERVTVLPNPAPNPAEAARVERANGPALVFAGRLTAAKNLDLALAALADVPGARLVVVGDGEERNRLERLATTLGVGERARFLGALPRPQVLGLLATADAVLLSSAWENFPHGAVEALAMGTPVIATRVGGVPEIVHDGVNGLLVESGDRAGLSAAIARLLADDDLRARLRSAAAPSVERFAADDVYGRLEAILREAVA